MCHVSSDTARRGNYFRSALRRITLRGTDAHVGRAAIPGNRIEGNHVTANDRGIDVDSSSNLIVKNSSKGNTTEYDIGGGNKVGTTSTDPTTAGPWDNFDF